MFFVRRNTSFAFSTNPFSFLVCTNANYHPNAVGDFKPADSSDRKACLGVF
jgi:hypothetical protein